MIDNISSSCIWFSINKVPSGVGVFCFVTLLLAVSAVPFFRQIFLLQANSVEPLSLAVRIFTSHHLSKGVSCAIAVLGFFYITIEEVFFLDLLRHLAASHFIPSFLKYFIFRFSFALAFQFVEQLSIVVIDFMGQLLSDFFLLFHESEELFLLFGDVFKFCLEIRW